MKAIAKIEKGPGAELIDIDTPAIGATEVLIKIKTASICGTDLQIYNWRGWVQDRVKPPQILGHEFAGEVVAAGKDVVSVKEGDYVSGESHIPCGTCYQCRTGRDEVCQNLKILGIDVHGCFAEYLVLPEKNIWINNPSLSPEVATLQEPLGNAVDTILIEDIAGKTIAILGCGPVGLLSVGVAKACGATTIIATDMRDYRLDLAKKMGATYLINPSSKDVVKEILDITDGIGVDVVAEMSGNPTAIHQGFEMLRPAGRMSLLGLPERPEAIDFTKEIIFKKIRLFGITGRRIFSTWYISARLLTSRLLDPTLIITHKLSLSDFKKAMELMEGGTCGKIVLYP